MIALLAASAQAQITDGSFEAGAFSGNWIEFSTNFGTPLCDLGCFNPPPVSFARTGTWFAWFGGIESYEMGSLEQVATIPAGTATLDLYLLIGIPTAGSGNGDYFEVRIDGNVEFNDTSVNLEPAYGADWALLQVDVSAYANGGLHTITLRSEVFGGPGQFSNFFVDDVSLEAGSTCYADCDLSGGLDFFDFLCFQNEFAAATGYADCDNSGGHDFFDFLCFQNEFAAGCP